MLIACDGAQSTVLHLLNVPCENLGTDDPVPVVDGRMSGAAPIKGAMAFPEATPDPRCGSTCPATTCAWSSG